MSLLRVKPCCLKLNVLISPILWCGFAAIKPQVSILCSVHAQVFAEIIVELFWLCSIKTKRQERVKLLNHAGKIADMRNEAVLWCPKQRTERQRRPTQQSSHSDWCTILNGSETKSIWEKRMENLTDVLHEICNKWMTSFKVMFRVQNQFWEWWLQIHSRWQSMGLQKCSCTVPRWFRQL